MSQKSTYTAWHGEMICAGLAEGHSLLEVCEALGCSYEAAKNWERDIPEHATNSTRAREIGCHALAEECLRIADTPLEGIETTEEATTVVNADSDGPGGIVVPATITKTKRGDMLGHRKLQIETRMRLIGKWLPKIYGDKLALGGADDLPPIKTMPDAQLLARIEALQAQLNGKG
jgi:hypothetical protein